MRESPRFLLALLSLAAVALIDARQARGQLTQNLLYRTAEYAQSSPSSVSLNGYFFSSRVFMTSMGDFDGGTLSYPGPGSPATYSLAYDAVNGPYLNYQTQYYPDSGTLDSAYPAGTYTTTATNSVTSATQTTSITWDGTDAYPTSIPTLTAASYAMLQNLDASAPATISFNSMIPDPSVTHAFVFFYVFDSSYDDVYDQTSLPYSTTSITIPADTLMPGTNYTFRLVFTDRIDSVNPDDGLSDEFGFDHGTDGTLITAAVPEPASLGVLSLACGAGLLRCRRNRA